MTELNSDICQTCQKPKNVSGSGSLTQWINCCQCNLTGAPESELITVCRACGKRMKEGRSGSVTQWIFADHLCKCENPQPVKVKTSGTTFKSKAFEEQDDDPNELPLDIDETLFPTSRYKPLRLLGHGALGQVYLCRDLHLRKKVALKSLFALTDDRIVSFQQEAKTASKLSHEKVIKVFDFGTSASGRPYMVMEYFPGRSLEEVIRDHGFLEQYDSCVIFQSICEALSHLHEHGIFHRDLKPSNILMLETETGEFDLRLIDFGLSKTTQDVQAKTNVQGRTVVGTPGYMSPDQASGLEYDARSEIYSLGCIMYESLAGQPPFSGESSLEFLNKHMRSDVLPLQELAPDVSPELCAIIEKCLSKNPEERFQTATEVSEALANFERGLFVESTERSSDSNDYRIEIPTQSFGVELPKDGKTANSNFGKILVGTSLVALIGLSAVIAAILLEKPQVRSTSTSSTVDQNLNFGSKFELQKSQRAKLIQRMKKSDVVRMDLRHACQDDDLLVLSGKTSLKEIDASDSDVSDRGIEHLSNVPNLQVLVLKNTKVKTLKDISKLEKLKTLRLDQTETNDESLKNLKGLRLKDLSLVETRITDKGLKALAALPTLENLHLPRNDIGPGAVEVAAKLPNLLSIDLRDTYCKAKDAETIAKSNLNIQSVLVSASEEQLGALREQFPTMTFKTTGLPLVETWSVTAEKEFIDHRYAEALKIYEKAYAACKARPSEKQNTRAVETGMSFCLYKLNQFNRAEELQRKLLSDYRAMNDKNAELNTLKMYTLTLLQLKKFDAADKQQERLLQLSEQLKGASSKEHRENEYSWAVACLDVGRFDKSIQLARDLRTKFSREIGSEDPMIGAIMIVEATALESSGRPGAVPLYRNGLAIIDLFGESELGPNERKQRQIARKFLKKLKVKARAALEPL